MGNCINGTAVLMLADGTAIAKMKGGSLNLTKDVPECTTKDSNGYKEYLHDGEKGATFDYDGNADFVGTTGNVDILTDFLMSDESPVIYFSTEVNGDIGFYATCVAKDVKIDAPENDVCKISGSFQVTGVLTKITVSGS